MTRPAPRYTDRSMREAWANREGDRLAMIVDEGWDGYDLAGVAARLGVTVGELEPVVAAGREVLAAWRAAREARQARGLFADVARPRRGRRAGS